MKTEPTDIDREAARLFVCVDGMRAGWCYTSITVVPPRNRCMWERVCDDGKEPDALDTDDPATAGCMLAQVEDAAGARVDMTWDWDFATRRFIEYVALWEGDDCIGVARRGRTRGAALVAAMKAIKGDPTQ